MLRWSALLCVIILFGFIPAFAQQQKDVVEKNVTFIGKIGETIIGFPMPMGLGIVWTKGPIIILPNDDAIVSLKLTEYPDKRFSMSLWDAVKYGLVLQEPTKDAKGKIVPFFTDYSITDSVGWKVKIICKENSLNVISFEEE